MLWKFFFMTLYALALLPVLLAEEPIEGPTGTTAPSYNNDHDHQNDNSNQQPSSWELPDTCINETMTYNIKIHWVTDLAIVPTDLKVGVEKAVDLWARAIVGKKKELATATAATTTTTTTEHPADSQQKDWSGTSQQVDLEDLCNFLGDGILPSFHFDGLILCLYYYNFEGEYETTIGTSSIVLSDPWQGNPMMAHLCFNSKYSNLGEVFWANTAAHEIGHGLGFSQHQEHFDSLILVKYHKSGFPYYWHLIGENTQREWNKLNTSLPHAPLHDGASESDDLSHWYPFCFSNELMIPYFEGSCEHERYQLSALTLAVFEDMGYEVNYNFADKDVVVQNKICGAYALWYDRHYQSEPQHKHNKLLLWWNRMKQAYPNPAVINRFLHGLSVIAITGYPTTM